MENQPGVHLLRGSDRATDVDALAGRLGGRVGLHGVLGDLNRRARVVRVPAPAAVWGFRWDREDMRSPRWWPQGISTCAEAQGPDGTGGTGDSGVRSVLVTTAYAQALDGPSHGARITVVDLTDPRDVRYRHVLLVEAFVRDDGAVDVRPVTVHAGGIVWHGRHLHVAGTARGLSSFRLDDVLRVPAGDATRLGIRGDRVDAFGHRYVLPVRFTYDAHAEPGQEPMRYSFASLDRSTRPHEVVVGEYGRDTMSTRLARYEVDPVTSLLRADGDGRSLPTLLDDGGVPGMQGATVVDGTWYVTNSRGRYRLGSVWVGRPGHLRERRWQLPVGPEDLTYWPARDQLWSLSEYPGARYVFAMPRERFGPRPGAGR